MENTKQLLFACAHCKRQANSEAGNSTFKLCAGCHNVRYCNRECQLADRKNHKVACKVVKDDSTSTATDLSDKLLYYCKKGDLIGVKREISQIMDINVVFDSHISALLLFSLILKNFYECTELLLQHNANPNLYLENGFTSLHFACHHGYEEFVTLLLRYKADPNIKSKDGYTPLFLSCDIGYDKGVSLLLQHNADPNITNTDCVSPLHISCAKGYDKCVLLLLKHNANKSLINNKDGSSPLHIACHKGHDKCVLLLLQHNTDVNIVITNGFSPLYIACQNGHDKCVSLLLQYIADLNIASNDGRSPLFIACENGHDKCVSLLLQHDANPNIVDKDGFSPLYVACQNGYDKCVSLLLQHNADPNIVRNSGVSSLHRACVNGHDKCVSLLLQAGANIECMNESGHTPFLSACMYGHLKCAALLVEHGANIHVRTIPDQQSALYLSCMSEKVYLVAYILSLEVDVNVATLNGMTPIKLCHVRGLNKYVKLLIEHGADASITRLSIPAGSITEQSWLDEISNQWKQCRKAAKHCDYPDCCNEGNDSQSLHACSSCRAVYYCSREHQEAHWREHKKLCKAIKK